MAPKPKLFKLHAQKAALKKVINNLLQQVQDFYEQEDGFPEELKRKLLALSEVIKRKFQVLKRLDEEILSAITDELEIEQLLEESTNFELNIEEQYTLIEEILSKHYPSNPSPTTSTISREKKNDSISQTVKLPRLEIAKFSGDYTKWQTFFGLLHRRYRFLHSFV